MASKSGYGAIVANGTTTILAKACMLERVLGINTSTGALLFYDSATAGNVAPAVLIGSVALSAASIVELRIPMQNGLTVVSTSLAGTATVVWSRV